MPALSPSACLQRLAEADADVFDRVVLIDVQVAFGLDRQIERRVLGEQRRACGRRSRRRWRCRAWPVPSRLSSSSISVSAVLRSMVAVRGMDSWRFVQIVDIEHTQTHRRSAADRQSSASICSSVPTRDPQPVAPAGDSSCIAPGRGRLSAARRAALPAVPGCVHQTKLACESTTSKPSSRMPAVSRAARGEDLAPVLGQPGLVVDGRRRAGDRQRVAVVRVLHLDQLLDHLRLGDQISRTAGRPARTTCSASARP